MSRHWPEIPCFLSLGSASLAALISAYGDPASVAADPSGAEALLRRSGRPGLSEEKIQAVLDSAQGSLGVPPVTAEHELLQWLGSEALAAHQEVRQVEREIERRVEHDALLLVLAAVIGKVSAAVLLAAAGSPLDYPNAASYLKALGLNLKEPSSAKHKGQLKITKRGPSVARFYLYFAALRLIASNPRVKRWYESRIKRPGGEPKNKSVIALMRKLAKALWHVARGSVFSTDKLFNSNAVLSA